ncbi:single-stranded DNA-binding protein [Solobacterium moorei]|uniref:single-stranded DNA-binding protein n=1 Tax=Solobacterium moorei TaxID=102148 RepID=UPI0024ADF4D8|nr:single-stranded DNA-binding protein [Solobacterium moorei]MDI6414433.1 single-stranded DNA-binding protein [Solobacterium moorei]
MINNVVLVGRLTKDIELRKTQSGLSVASFTVACDRRLSQEQKNNGEQSADFISCVAWRGSADFLGKYARKGDTVGVEGRIQTRNYDRDGQRVYVTEVLANSVNLLHSKQTAQSQEQATYEPQPTQVPTPQQMSDFDYLPNVEVSSDDLPF